LNFIRGKIFTSRSWAGNGIRQECHRETAAVRSSSSTPATLMVTRLDRLARSTRDPLNTLAALTGKQAGLRSLGDAWANTPTPRVSPERR
jgi:DNA invertase Pin-like site-specific DNA recombinase